MVSKVECHLCRGFLPEPSDVDWLGGRGLKATDIWPIAAACLNLNVSTQPHWKPGGSLIFVGQLEREHQARYSHALKCINCLKNGLDIAGSPC